MKLIYFSTRVWIRGLSHAKAKANKKKRKEKKGIRVRSDFGLVGWIEAKEMENAQTLSKTQCNIIG